MTKGKDQRRHPARTPRQAARLLLLRALAALTAPFRRPRARRQPPARILVLRPDHLGDALFTTPALRALREAFPAATVTCLVGPWATAVYGRLSECDRLVECKCPGFTPHGKRSPWEPYTLLWRTARLLRSHEFDLVLNLRFDFWWGALLAHAAGIPERIGYDVPECVPFLTRPVPYRRGRHEVAQNLRLVAEVAADSAERERWLEARLAGARLAFPLADAEKQAAAKLLAALGAQGRPVVAIHPGTRGRAKLWSAEGWAAVADGLSERLGAVVVLTGGEGERELCAAVRRRMARPATVVAGQTTLGELVAFFAHCALVLGVDSGPLHLAVAAGVPTVHLYGPSDHVAFGPFGDPNRHVVVRAGVHCSPCHRFTWSLDSEHEHDCMRAITPAAVLQAAERALATTAARDSGDPPGTDPAVSPRR